MSGRAFFLDRCVGETRGVVTLDGRPERLMIARDGEAATTLLGEGRNCGATSPARATISHRATSAAATATPTRIFSRAGMSPRNAKSP